MPYNPPNIGVLENEIKADIKIFFPDANTEELNSFVAVIARLNALQVARIHQRIRENVNELHPSTASIPTLYVMAKGRGLVLRPATFSRGGVVVSGPANAVIPINTEFRSQRGIRFKNTVAVAVGVDGEVEANLRSVLRGREGNIAPGVKLTSAIRGIEGVADAAGFAGGADPESSAELRLRLSQLYNSGTPIGRDDDWAFWVRQYAGVSRVWIARDEFNTGTITIRFAIDDVDHNQGVPTDAEVQGVSNLLNSFVSGYVRYRVVKQILVPLDIEVVGLSPDTVPLRNSIEQAIRTRINTSAEPGANIPVSWVLDSLGGYASTHRGVRVNGADSASSSILLNIGEYPYVNSVTFVDSSSTG